MPHLGLVDHQPDLVVEQQRLAVANAFVSMVSPRAWRDAIGMDQAMDMLRQQRDQAFDRRVVTALEHALENRGGRSAWSGFAARPAMGAA